MRCWLFFHRELAPDVPEAAEVQRFQQAATKAGIELTVLQPRDFDLIVDSDDNWSAVYRGRKLQKPDLIIPRTGSETSYFTFAVLRHFERLGVAMVNGPAARSEERRVGKECRTRWAADQCKKNSTKSDIGVESAREW